MYKGVRCRERIKLQPTAANLKKAERHRAAILTAIENGNFDYAITFPDSKRALQFQAKSSLTVETWLYQWLDSKEKSLKSSTYDGYLKTIKHVLIPKFGNVPIVDIKKGYIREWCETLECSEKRMKNVISVFRSALQDAVYFEHITDNPLYNFKIRRNEAPRESDVDPFTKDEQSAILAVCDGQIKNLFQFAFWTGLRTSEIIALEWRDIDFDRMTANIRRARTQVATKAETTKTRSGTREIKLLSPALEALERQREFTKKGVIFLNPRTGLHWEGDAPIRKTAWTPALKRAEVRYRRPYQTRHTFASMMLSSGEPIAWVSNQLGHSTVLMTASAYATYIPDSRPDAGELAVKLFG